MKNTYQTERGFTLIELMITCAIIAILAAVAYPSYRDSVLRAKRSEGRAALMRTMQSEERYYTANNGYIDSANAAFTAANGFRLFSGDTSTNSAYSISAALSTTACGSTVASSQCVVLTATANLNDSKCGILILNSAGGKTSLASGTTTPLTTGCW